MANWHRSFYRNNSAQVTTFLLPAQPDHTQAEDATRSAELQLEASKGELTRAKSQLAVTRRQLQHAESGQVSTPLGTM